MPAFTHNFFRRGLFRFTGSFGKALLLGTGASLLVAGGNAQAVETIQLRYDGTDPNVPSSVTLSLGDIQTFVRSGELPQRVREFLNISQEQPGPLQRVFTDEIQIPSDLRENLRGEFTDTAVGRFLLTRIERLIQGPNVAPNLRTAIRQSLQDDRNISLLEIIQNYPADTVTLNITGLVTAYDDISAFVDRVLPALEVARQYLQDVICKCEQPSANAAPGTTTAASSAVKSNLTAAPALNCVPQNHTSLPTVPQSVAQPQSTQLP